MTRDLEWGVPLPKELGSKWEGKVMYVWVSCAAFLQIRSSQRTWLTSRPSPVRRPNWLPVNYGQLHRRVEAVVAEPGERQAVPVYGQGTPDRTRVLFPSQSELTTSLLQDNGTLWQ